MITPIDSRRLSSIFAGSGASSAPETQARSSGDTSTIGHRASWSWASGSELDDCQVSINQLGNASVNEQRRMSAAATSRARFSIDETGNDLFNAQQRTSAAASTGLVPRSSASIDTLDEFPLDRFVYDPHPIAAGTSGTICCGQDLVRGRPVAIKVMDRRFINSALQEWEVGWAMQDCPHVPNVYGLFRDRTSLYLVQELISGVNLQQWIASQSGGLSEAVVRNIFRQVLQTVHLLHTRNIIHRDIKPANILYDSEGKILLVDFGTSASSHCRRRSYVGTPSMMAPETFGAGDDESQDSGYDAKVDTWSLGILLFEMLTGTVPFPSGNVIEFMHRYERGRQGFELTQSQMDLLNRNSSREACDLALAMLEFDSRRRIGVEQVLSHPWVTPPLEALP